LKCLSEQLQTPCHSFIHARFLLNQKILEKMTTAQKVSFKFLSSFSDNHSKSYYFEIDETFYTAFTQIERGNFSAPKESIDSKIKLFLKNQQSPFLTILD
jgi:hypothetical protein